MKNLNLIFAGIILTFLVGCNKSRVVQKIDNDTFITNKESKSKIEDALKTMPLIVKIKDEANNRFIDFDVRNKTVSINKTWSFANPQPNTIYAQGSGLVVYVSSSTFGFGSSNSTSTITAGNTSLNVQTLCLAVDASAYAAMFQAQSGQLPISGISVVMGLDVDWALLQNASTANFGNYFHGLAYYLVYDFPASGSYNVIDWTGANGITSLDGFAMVFSFGQNNNGSFYFSKTGTLNVNGGDMTYNGDYWGIEGLFNTINNGLTFQTYSGSGTMGCN
jgi:hypothetical protein